ncbi:putative ORFan [Tupanvirus deep ocean]|uniref:ORFan n=2 Tax=Tupanvirus TaxID=2094720 RepID=A0AC62A705_9VIRU|nr:putative ORFan [Tupanvirus deep ocean]QKU33557.1 putative ORFan [Tupanvirus deep ocean]
MNKELLNLFNNGDNNGTIVIHSIEDIQINCHDFVFQSQCEYGLVKNRFEKKSGRFEPIKLDYSAKLICAIISRMYASEYVFADLDIDEIIELVELAHEIYVKNIDQIVSNLVELFQQHINDDNWAVLLTSVFGNLSMKPLEKVLIDYFYYEILAKNTLVFPQVDIANEEIVKVLYDLYEKNNRKPIYKPYIKPKTGFPKFIEMIGIEKYNIDSQKNIKKIGMDNFKHILDIPELENCSDQCKYETYRKFYIYCLVINSVIEECREKLFGKLRDVHDHHKKPSDTGKLF